MKNNTTNRMSSSQLRTFFSRAGVKLTHQRLTIYNVVSGMTEHPDAETIYRHVGKHLPTISLDTVYRTLWMFNDLGLLSTLGPPRDRMRFDANLALHHHFYCQKCGLTLDFESKDLDRLPLPDAIGSFGMVQKAQVEVKGICKRCSQKRINRSLPTATRRKNEEKIDTQRRRPGR